MLSFYRFVCVAAFVSAYLGLPLISLHLLAQNQEPDNSYIRLGWQQQKFEGLTQYMLFHNTTATNLPYHQHYIYDPFGTSTETITSLQLEARYYFNRRSFLMINLPYSNNKRVTADTLNLQEHGIGDLTIIGGYQLYNSLLFKPNAVVKHLFLLQGGIKAPTGIYDRFNEINEVEPHSMPGSGSLNFLFSGQYWLEIRGFQMGSSVNYYLNRANKYTFRYGNATSLSLLLRYRLPLFKIITFSPLAGINWLSRNQDYMNKQPTPEFTKASWVVLQTGVIVQKGRLQADFIYHLPIQSKVIGPQIEYKAQWQVGLQYNIPQRSAQKMSSIPHSK